jgi:hypothetical protein
MVEFLKIDLDEHHQPAIVRLKDSTITITQAIFSDGGATLTCFGTDVETKRFLLDTETMTVLVAAWTDYQMRICTHQEEKEAQKQAMIAEAKALAKSVHFDLDTLNVRAKCENERWRVKVPALGYEVHNIHVNELKNAVLEAFDRIEHDVISAETWHWTSNEWPEIIASYRRAFPKEPEEIQQARKLLAEAGLTGWILTHCHPEPEANCWSFVLDPDDQDSFALIDKPAAEMLAFVQMYLDTLKQQAPETARTGD